jgi:hypothetical protein
LIVIMQLKKMVLCVRRHRGCEQPYNQILSIS